MARTYRLLFEYESGGEAINVTGDRIVVVPTPGPLRYILLTRNFDHFIAMEAFVDKPLHEIARAEFILNRLANSAKPGLSRYVIGDFDPQLKEAFWAPPNHVIASFENDSVYSVNLANHTASMIFNPANEVQIRVGAAGVLAFFSPNGYKLYLEPTDQKIGY